jgi:hypothetical protein
VEHYTHYKGETYKMSDKMSVEKHCEGCPLKDAGEPECDGCMGYLPSAEPNSDIPNPFDYIDFDVFGATQEEVDALKKKFRDIITTAHEKGRLPTEPRLLRIFLVRVLQGVLRGHYNTY